ncbi:P-loop containing nucleoside triphosphate hydrolase protein [Flammula alnicola]|nr:P-loop containing nucleoside triphosphate hydrolase protein [Flammula alnicola]
MPVDRCTSSQGTIPTNISLEEHSTPNHPTQPFDSDTSEHELTHTPNVIIFGETGTGKSSLVNMIAGKDLAEVSSQALGCTFSSRHYDVSIDIGSKTYRLWDTCGLNEGEQGTVPADAAMKNLRDLVQNLQGGINLLVYCIRGTRFRDIWVVNYDLFSQIICEGKVPIVIVITGLEHEDPDMDGWWEKNSKEFARRGMQFASQACVTTTKGKKSKSGSFMFEEEYEESTTRVRDVISQNCARSSEWMVDSNEWLRDITIRMATYNERYERRTGTERDVLTVDPLSLTRDQPSFQVPTQRGEARNQEGEFSVQVCHAFAFFIESLGKWAFRKMIPGVARRNSDTS